MRFMNNLRKKRMRHEAFDRIVVLPRGIKMAFYASFVARAAGKQKGSRASAHEPSRIPHTLLRQAAPPGASTTERCGLPQVGRSGEAEPPLIFVEPGAPLGHPILPPEPPIPSPASAIPGAMLTGAFRRQATALRQTYGYILNLVEAIEDVPNRTAGLARGPLRPAVAPWRQPASGQPPCGSSGAAAGALLVGRPRSRRFSSFAGRRSAARSISWKVWLT